MESDDEMLFSPPEEPASPIHRSRLKRLKKGARLPISPAVSLVVAASSEEPDSLDLDVGEVAPDAEIGGFDHGSVEIGVDSDEAGEHVEMMDSEELGGIGCSNMSQNDGEVGDEPGKSEKFSNEGEEEGKEVKKRAKSQVDGDTTTPVDGKRRKNGKERKAYLTMMHAESQRLLRETRHVSFEPVPLVHKPISSVLEKIRRRKLELSNRFNLAGTFVKDVEMSLDQARSDGSDALEHGSKGDSKKLDKEVTNKHQEVSQGGIKSKKVCQSETSDSEYELPEEESYSPEESEKFVPSVLATNLNYESPLEEDSSQEEDYNKENIDPFPVGVDPARNFVDDEAEVESDSDNDSMGSADSKEEGKESDEELEDLIAPTYEETKVDHERRDELHQIWLQQQDTAATENLCQRLQAQNNRDESALQNIDEEDRASLELDHSDESMANEPPPRGTKKRIKELRQWSLQMFNDDDDKYQSSGDEDEDSVPSHQVHHDRIQDQTSFISSESGSDERSREKCLDL